MCSAFPKGSSDPTVRFFRATVLLSAWIVERQHNMRFTEEEKEEIVFSSASWVVFLLCNFNINFAFLSFYLLTKPMW